MAEIRPFRGVRYNESKVGDLSAVICPPYDIITPQMEIELYHRSEYNFIRIEYGRQLPQDRSQDNKYIRSAAILEQWLKQGVLITDEVPKEGLPGRSYAPPVCPREDELSYCATPPA